MSVIKNCYSCDPVTNLHTLATSHAADCSWREKAYSIPPLDKGRARVGFLSMNKLSPQQSKFKRLPGLE